MLMQHFAYNTVHNKVAECVYPYYYFTNLLQSHCDNVVSNNSGVDTWCKFEVACTVAFDIVCNILHVMLNVMLHQIY